MKLKPTVLCIVAIILFSNSGYAQGRQFIPEDKLRGPVHIVQTENAEVIMIFGKAVEIGRTPHQKVIYDRQGNELERINFRKDGSVENRSVRSYDSEGHFKGDTGFKTENGIEISTNYRSELVYDERGNRVEALVYNKEELVQRTTSRYDSTNHLLEETMVTDGGAYKQTKKLTYNVQGHLLKTLFDTNGRIELLEQTYDDAGHMLTYKYSNSDGHNDQSSKYVYDALGKEIERTAEDSMTRFKVVTTYDSKGRISQQTTDFEYKRPGVWRSHSPEPGIVEFHYNDKDQVTEVIFYSVGGVFRKKTVNEYDDQGRLQAQAYSTIQGKDGSRSSYQYDEWGNLIKTIAESQGQLDRKIINVNYRIITYYD